MSDSNLHIDKLEEKSAEFFSQGKIVWSKPQEQVLPHSAQLAQLPEQKTRLFVFTPFLKYTIAVFVLLVLTGTAPFIFQKTVTSFPGEHVTVELPDGSEITLNADSYLKYYPLKWKFQRKIKFEGEAFFQVQQGKEFWVESENGTTEVLGASFNIYTRDKNYRVTCLTGKVKVNAGEKTPVILTPDSQGDLINGKTTVSKNLNANDIISWKNNRFFFSGNPLHEVIDEIERQYNVTIKIQNELYNRKFAGSFPKKFTVEEVLDFVCKTMRVKFVKQSENIYLIVQNS